MYAMKQTIFSPFQMKISKLKDTNYCLFMTSAETTLQFLSSADHTGQTLTVDTLYFH